MSWHTDWLIAEVADAEAVAGIATGDEHTFDDWPHLAMRSVGVMELMTLRGVLLGRPGETEGVDGEALHDQDGEDGGVAVTAVPPGFLSELAALPAEGVEPAAILWQGTEPMAEWDAATMAELLRQMVAFAQRAGREGKSVLQLSTW